MREELKRESMKDGSKDPPWRGKRPQFSFALLMTIFLALGTPVLAQDLTETTSDVPDSTTPADELITAHIRMVNESTAAVVWNLTDNIEPQLCTGYRIYVECEQDMECCEPCINKSGNAQESEGHYYFEVQSATTYNVTVICEHSNGTVISSPPAILTTNSTAPNRPLNFTEKAEARSITWEFYYGCPYTGTVDFQLNLSELADSLLFKVSMDEGKCKYSATASDLQPFTNYSYSFLSMNYSCVLTAEPSTTPEVTSSQSPPPITGNTNASETDTSSQLFTAEPSYTTDVSNNTSLPSTELTSNSALVSITKTPAITEYTSTLTILPNNSGDPDFSLEPTTDVPVTEDCVIKAGNITTLPDIPGEPRNLILQKPSFVGNPIYSQLLNISWEEPDCTGILKEYRLEIESSGNSTNCTIPVQHATKHCPVTWNCSAKSGKCKIPLDTNTNYTVKLSARNEEPDKYGRVASKTVETKKWGKPYIDERELPYFKFRETKESLYKQLTITIHKNWFLENGKITKFQILLKRKDETDFRPVYSSGEKLPDSFTFGSGNRYNCELAEACNPELDSSTTYYFKFRLISGDKHSDSKDFEFKTEVNYLKRTVNAVLIIFFILLAILIIGIIVYLKYFTPIVKRGDSMEQPLLISTSPDEAINKSILLSDLSDTVDRLMDDGQLELQQEYQELKSISPSKSTDAAKNGYNDSKNRYINILPFDESRVILNTYRGFPNSDYINASYIHGFKKEKQFIACQGPRDAEKEDFWRMVWEKNVHVIVMVTKCVETNREKCCKYWPDEKETRPQEYLLSNICVKTLMETSHQSEGFIFRRIELTKQSMMFHKKRRIVRQFHYTLWPDMGCPKNPDHLIHFVNVVKKAVPQHSSHTLVHCSAGVGRTGTFIALSNLMDEMKERGSIDIFQTVYKMRQNRENMVQTQAQYTFIYQCVLRCHQTGADKAEVNMPDDIPDVITATFPASRSTAADDDDACYDIPMNTIRSSMFSTHNTSENELSEENEPFTDDECEIDDNNTASVEDSSKNDGKVENKVDVETKSKEISEDEKKGKGDNEAEENVCLSKKENETNKNQEKKNPEENKAEVQKDKSIVENKEKESNGDEKMEEHKG